METSTPRRSPLPDADIVAGAGFSLQDNPFAQVHPRFAAQWSHGYFAAHTLDGITAALLRGALDATPTT